MYSHVHTCNALYAFCFSLLLQIWDDRTRTRPPPCANTRVSGNAVGVVGRGRSSKSAGESSSLWRWLWQMLLLLQVCKLATLLRLLWHLSRTVPQSHPCPSSAFTWWFLFSFYLGAPRTTMWFWRSRERFSMEELR